MTSPGVSCSIRLMPAICSMSDSNLFAALSLGFAFTYSLSSIFASTSKQRDAAVAAVPGSY